ncbi:MAG: MotA/TolQ/ExbB proton channel family protein [Endozoicomonas sp. (ex Botrylloides leachii)]|nr:MotA/TolQ/ExbB proton channel family protein [Endozoicomonas sp. (ex Botrylloides leachii)]
MLTEQLASLGAMAWPLIILSCLGLAILLERLATYAMLPSIKKNRLQSLFEAVQTCRCNESQQRNLSKDLSRRKGIQQGIAVLLSHSNNNKAMREEIAGLWLLKQQQALQCWLKPLMLIGILSPMFGLLGTVLGLIHMFQGIAATAGPVTPDVLAGGLWEAMYTTAFGLFIAIPALAGAHGLGVWASHYVGQLEIALNHTNLLLEGMDIDSNGFIVKENPADKPPLKSKAEAILV